MKKPIIVLAFAAVSITAVALQQPGAVPPPWAYGFANAPGAPAPPAPPAAPPAADNGPQTIPGSKQSFTLAQVRDGFAPADWFPEDHPAMPDIVAHGKRDQMINACGLCHYPNGKGRPENAGIAGLPSAYFIQTMLDFKNDLRKSTDSRKANTNRMIAFAKTMSDDDIKATAAYFSSMKWTPWVRVVETDSVPTTRISAGMFVALDGAQAGKEPIGQRIVEVPEKTNDTENLRNPRSSFIAYAPIGSIKKGEALVTTGGGKTTACAVCHGSTLDGLGPVPGLAGRSPSYLVRQLFDMQQGARKGEWGELMKPVVAKLTLEDMVNIAAYTASRAPGGK